MAGKTTGAASMHIDTRLPNGGGALQGGAFTRCKAFPDPSVAGEASLQQDDFVPML
jgi:hypothetical protein